MNRYSKRFTAFVGALLLIAPVTSGVANAKSTQIKSKETVALDHRSVGSIERGTSIRNCDPTSANAGVICKITGGNPNAKFPSAPNTSFGF